MFGFLFFFFFSKGTPKDTSVCDPAPVTFLENRTYVLSLIWRNPTDSKYRLAAQFSFRKVPIRQMACSIVAEHILEAGVYSLCVAALGLSWPPTLGASFVCSIEWG